MADLELAFETARAISKDAECDIYLYNGEISRRHDLEFLELVSSNKRNKDALLVLVTNGGDPDAGYKISRYFQKKYDQYTVIVPSLCKSAGTLIALGANTLAFTRYGELGPLDIQTVKQDNLAERMSGLTVKEALKSISRDAIESHGKVFTAIIRDTNAIISVPTAAKAASELITGLYAPMFSQIDPYDVGDKARAMRIAIDYGRRLEAETKNLNENTLTMLASTYPSHSFVIDYWEARELFKDVRLVTDQEQLMISCLGAAARDESIRNEPTTVCLSQNVDIDQTDEADGGSNKGGAEKDSSRSASSEQSSGRRREGRRNRG